MCTETLLRACIAERERIGREVHDTISQDLAGANMLLRILERKLKHVSAEDAEAAGRVAECIDLALSHLRCLMRGLAAVEMSATQLTPALGQLCDETSRLFSVRCRLLTNGGPPRLTNGAATHLYCLAREALCNAVRHGQATEVVVALRTDGTKGELTVSDNGNEFHERPNPANGLGRRIMDHRARQVGGKLNVMRQPAGGTVVTSSFSCSSRKRERSTHSGRESCGCGDC